MQVAVIGAGAMGGGIARGLIAAGFPPSDIIVSNPTESKLQPFETAGCRVTTDNTDAVSSGADIVFLCVKPWKVQEVMAEIEQSVTYGNQTIAVVAAGIPAERLSGWMPRAKMYLVMPNTGLNINSSMTLLVDVNADNTSKETLRELLSRLGSVMDIEERLLPAATAIASCGIAYLMRYVRAAMQAGIQLGLRPAEAQQLTAAAMTGAGRLLSSPDTHPETEIDKVTTPGGLTIKGLNALDANGFTNAVIQAVLASSK